MEMLLILVIAATLFLLQMIIEPLKKKIQNATGVKESNKTRKKAKIVILVFGLLGLFIITVAFWHDGSHDFTDLFTEKPLLTILYAIVIVVWYWAIAKEVFFGEYQIAKHLGFKEVFLKISTEDINDIPNKYILYLRGFEQDSYDLPIEIEDSAYEGHFNESRLCAYLSTCLPIYAVGMNKELWQPNGATRIYVDDDNWMEEVKLLMEKSVFNIILINDRKSCIWEIEQSRNILDKTIFIVDDTQKYKNAKNAIKSIELPDVDLEKHLNGFCFYMKDSHHEVIPFDPAYESEYGKLSNFIKEKSRIQNRLNKDTKLLYIISAVLSLIPFAYSITIIKSFSDPLFIPSICVSLIAFASYWMLLKMKKNGFYVLIFSMLCALFLILKYYHQYSYFTIVDLLIPSIIINGFLVLVSPKHGITSKAFFDLKS